MSHALPARPLTTRYRGNGALLAQERLKSLMADRTAHISQRWRQTKLFILSTAIIAWPGSPKYNIYKGVGKDPSSLGKTKRWGAGAEAVPWAWQEITSRHVHINTSRPITIDVWSFQVSDQANTWQVVKLLGAHNFRQPRENT